jgi:hypothetical protein
MLRSLSSSKPNPFLRCLALVILVAGSGEQSAAQNSSANRLPEDPFAFCARVGNDDREGKSAGAANDAALKTLAPYLREAMRLPRDALLSPNEIVWRCMNGKVYACARGANIPCDSKADRSKFNPGAVNYCRENPNASDVPAYATGHNTLYLWKCLSGQAARGKPLGITDRRGFRTDFWYLIESGRQNFSN